MVHRPTSVLPQHTTSFIGRTTEIKDIISLMGDSQCRLLTLIGPGGSGKTRLALEVASGVDSQFADGICYVPLQAVQNTKDMLTSLIDVLPVQLTGRSEPRSLLLNYLRDKELLMVLDNFEHLMDGVDILTDILAATTAVRLFVTSRQRLNLLTEQVWPVYGLDVPELTENMPDTYSAVQLFLERAGRVEPHFSFTDQRDSVIRLCQLTAGLPLALELAASWVRVMPCEMIADQIQNDIDILTSSQRDLPQRHGSMRAVFDHSWHLLREEERGTFRKLCVFRGGFTLEAAMHVSGASLPIVASLIDRSLVQLGTAGRYHIHELLRQYGDEHLNAWGEYESTRNAHSDYYSDFILQRAEDLKGRRQIESIAEINADFENVRAGHDWAALHKYQNNIEQMIDGLWIFCNYGGRHQEGLMLFQYAEQQFAPESDERSQRIRGRLLARVAAFDISEMDLEIAFQIAQRYNDRAEMAFCLSKLGEVANAKQEYDHAIRLMEQSLSIYRQLNDRFFMAGVFFRLMMFSHKGTWEDFKHFGDEALHLYREIGDRVGTGWSLGPVALGKGRLGQLVEAERLWLERCTLGYEIGNLHLVALSKAHMSHKVYFFQGNFAQARAAAEEALELEALTGHSDVTGWAMPTLGLLACMDENYELAISLSQQAAAAGSHTWHYDLATWGRSIAACGLNDFDGARIFFSAAVGYLTKMHGKVGIISSLPVAALILAHQGSSLRAVEWLALAFTHPLGISSWIPKWPLLDRFRSDLEAQLDEEAFAAAWERGKLLQLESVMRELLTEFASTDGNPIAQANQALPHPLTPRELEILGLLCEGLSNAQIAERLFISIGTVKSYNNKIYGKLAITGRTQIVLRAQELRLL